MVLNGNYQASRLREGEYCAVYVQKVLPPKERITEERLVGIEYYTIESVTNEDYSDINNIGYADPNPFEVEHIDEFLNASIIVEKKFLVKRQEH